MISQRNNAVKEIKQLLDEKAEQYNCISFIENDPILIPHKFTRKEDIEVSGLLTATIAWGKRKSIIANATRLMELMDDAPYEFVVNASAKDLKRVHGFVHRTFNGTDCEFFLTALRTVYKRHGGLETVFSKGLSPSDPNVCNAIVNFRKVFLQTKHMTRSEKHISDPSANSSAKRLCMYLRWMVRKDKKGVDFGIWTKISPSQLCLPLDVHTGNVSRLLGLLSRKQNDWKAVIEVTENLKQFDAVDPVKYDFALFGIGVNQDL